MSQHPKLFAPVNAPRDYPRVRHTVGLPQELGGDPASQPTKLPWPRVVIVEKSPDAGVVLLRLSADGAFAGDTWHPTLEEAKEQARVEFGESLGPWREIPMHVVDADEYALRHSS